MRGMLHFLQTDWCIRCSCQQIPRKQHTSSHKECRLQSPDRRTFPWHKQNMYEIRARAISLRNSSCSAGRLFRTLCGWDGKACTSSLISRFLGCKSSTCLFLRLDAGPDDSLCICAWLLSRLRSFDHSDCSIRHYPRKNLHRSHYRYCLL